MSKIRDIARVTMREARGAETVEQQAWLVWRTLRTACERRGTAEAKAYQGVPGHQLSISLNGVIQALWPEWTLMERKEFSDKTQPIYTYLKTSGNARCLRNPGRDSSDLPVWWLRDEWFGGQAIVVPALHHPRDPDRSRREARLTPTEAGEDREPAPVVVTAVEAATGPAPDVPEPEPAPAPEPEPARLTREQHLDTVRELANERKRQITVDKVVDALTTIEGWITAAHLSKHGIHALNSRVKEVLDALVADGMAETKPGGRQNTLLYRAAGSTCNELHRCNGAGESGSEPDIISHNGTNGTSPADVVEPAPDVVEPSPTPLRARGLGTVMEEIGKVVEHYLNGVDVDHLQRERDDAVLRVDVLEAENRALKAKLDKFRRMLED